MKTNSQIVVAGALLLSLGAGALQAQTDHAHFGVHALYSTTFDDAGVGAQLSVPMARHLEFYPSFDVYFQSPGSLYAGNIDVKYRTSGRRYDWVYVGTGINIAHQSVGHDSETQAGWNLFAGAESLRGEVHPFAEARVTVTDQTRFQIQAGINITLGRAR